jgi:hypothetical protein
VREVDPTEIVETIREGVLERDPVLTGQPGSAGFADTFTVIPRDTPREKEGLQ